jgi:hypothetical protein
MPVVRQTAAWSVRTVERDSVERDSIGHMYLTAR